MTHQQRIVAVCIHKCRTACCINFFRTIKCLSSRNLLKHLITHLTGIGSRHLTNSHLRIFLRENTLFIKLKFYPWRITTNNIKSIPQPENLNKLQHWVEEMVTLGKAVGYLQAQRILLGKQRHLSMRVCKNLFLGLCHNLRFIFCHFAIFRHILRYHIRASTFQSLTGFGVELRVINIKQSLYVAPELLASRQVVSIVILPKPQRTPIVHRKF